MEHYRFIDLGEATLENYRETRRSLLRKASDLTLEMSALEPVRTIAQMNELLALEQERKLIIEMIASCSYVIEWLETGRMPGNRRGIERRAGYQREVLTDPARLPSMRAETAGRPAPGLDENSRARLESALQGLTERERDCYSLANGENFSMAEIAQLLGISKSSVGTYLTRAQRKVTVTVQQGSIRVG